MPLSLLVRTGSLTTVLAFLCIIGQAQLVANFSATPISGCAPQVVVFNDLSSGNPTSWRWDLGNNTISTQRNPSTIYNLPGQYTVKLVVRNANGVDSLIKSQYITIYAPPVVAISASATLGCYPMWVQFTDLSIAGSGTITQWQWDFGDGNSSTQRNPSHTYNAGGNYNVSLRVTNSNGCVTSKTFPAYIQLHNGVDANFSTSSPSSCSAPVNITFANLTTGTGTLSYNWSFGDGNTSTLPSPTHNYANPGSYTVRLIVTNSTGCRDTLIRVNAVTVGSVQANFTVPASSCINTGIQFTNTSVPTPVNVLWRFGDGTTSTALNPVKSYSAPGVYQVKLVSYFAGCRDSIIKPITILPKPDANFTGTPTGSCQAPLTVNFTNTSVGGSTAVWDFGDGTTSTQLNPTHTYTTAGTYTVRLITGGGAGCADTLVRQNYITMAPPAMSIPGLPAQGCAPLTINFNPIIGTSEPITSYLWEFGDGNVSTLANPTHTYDIGTFTVKLTIVTASGCSNSVSYGSGVKAGPKPTANFSADPRNVCAEIPIRFTDFSSGGNIDEWEWQFGDGGTSEEPSPTYVYTDTGDFDVQLVVTSNGCSDTINFIKYIRITPPVAIFSVATSCGATGGMVFTDESIGADTWLWNFGDGTTSTDSNTVHTYASPGTYIVTLTVTNNETGCSYTKTAEIDVLVSSRDFTVLDTAICRNSRAVFNAAASSTNIASYEWDFGDGSIGTGDTISHVYPLSGYYDITLITTDLNGCRDTIIRPDYIRVNGPTADFNVTSASTCSINVVPLIDSSTTDGVNPITSWTWNYGDGVIETLQSGPFQHLYSTPGQYDISLLIVDAEGCKDSITKPSVLTISQPVADFVADTLACPAQSLKFTNLSDGTGLNFTWDFGDGRTSTADTPYHSYAANGTYTVKLMTVDQFGCTDTIIKNNYIRVTTPFADFSVSDTVGTCPPLVVDFTNSSVNYNTLNWDFGDSTSSQSPNPSHFYATPGVYMAKLTVGVSSGCISVKTTRIVVRGPQGTFTYGGLQGCNNLTVNFVASTRDRLSFIWDFNDGNTLVTTDSVVSYTYSTLGNYVPKMILKDAGGCVVPITGLDTIRITGATAAFNINSQTLCNSGSVQFNNTTISNDGIRSYRWDFGDGDTSSAANPVHVYDTAGMYYPKLTVTTLSGCVDSTTSVVPVRVVANPQASIAQSANGCTPVSVSFNGSLMVPDTSAITWRWNFGNGDSSSLQNPGPQTYSSSGVYNVLLKVTNSSGCVDTVSTTVEAYVIPQVSAGNDRDVCLGSGSPLQASGAATYTWTQLPGLSCYDCSNPVATPDSSVVYYVTGTTAQGCTNLDSVMILVVRPLQIRDSGADTVCLGRSVPLVAAGAYSYQWSPPAGLNTTTVANPIATPAASTTYMVVGTDHKNCFTDTAYVPIKVYPIPTVNAGPDKTINVGQMTDLVPVISQDVTTVTWSPTGSIFRNFYPAITVKPRETTEYQVLVANEGGCRSRDNVIIYVLCDGANVFIPNTFSPNADGMNDVFYPRGTGVFSVKAARVYNRWGEVVYERTNFQSNDASAGWDGTYKGVKLNADVYVYTIDILCDNNSVLPYKGNITLIK